MQREVLVQARLAAQRSASELHVLSGNPLRPLGQPECGRCPESSISRASSTHCRSPSTTQSNSGTVSTVRRLGTPQQLALP